jgi:CBS domain-containing protein
MAPVRKSSQPGASEAFVMNRPAGRRGGAISLAKPWEDAMLTAADVMTTDVVTVVPETPVRDIARLLHTKRISGVPVVSPDNRVIGIVSEGDLIGHAQIVGEPRRS